MWHIDSEPDNASGFKLKLINDLLEYGRDTLGSGLPDGSKDRFAI